jgi:hypothetical protein
VHDALKGKGRMTKNDVQKAKKEIEKDIEKSESQGADQDATDGRTLLKHLDKLYERWERQDFEKKKR